MLTNRIVEYVFFFGLLGIVGYLMWELLSPFISALAFAAIIVTICHPIYERLVRVMPRKSRSLAAFISTLLAVFVVVIPAMILGLFLFNEATSIYQIFSSGSQFSIERALTDFESLVQQYIPAFSLDITSYVRQGTAFISSNLAQIFTQTASTLFLFFIALIATFYFFRDGKEFTRYLIKISPLPDDDDEVILRRLSNAVRSVAVGAVLIALIQGTLTAIGLSIFGFDRAVLWGTIAAFCSLMPGLGTPIVFIPAVIYLVLSGSYLYAIGVAIWGALAVGLIDNLLGPYFISRGAPLHPFLILLSVIGGIILFGPIGFVAGPVILSLFNVLLELYATHIATNEEMSS